MKKEYFKIILIFIIAIFLEVIIFNITSYRTLFGNYEELTYVNPEYMYEVDEKVYLRIDNVNTEIVSFKLNLKEFEGVTEYKLYYSDETSSEYFDLTSKNYISDLEKSKYIPLYLSGDTTSLVLSINKDIYVEQHFDKVVLNEKIPFEFNFFRFFIVFAFFILSYFIKNSKIFNEEYSNKNLKQEYILLGIIAVFFVLLSYINTYSSSEIDVEKMEGDSKFNFAFETTEGIYNKDFVDSLKNGKFYLLFDGSEEFLNLENPYDALSRSGLDRNLDYKWDTAFFNGHFYIYFGILPALLIFLPYHLLTGNYLKISIVIFGFSILIFILLKEILLKLLSRYFEKIQFKNVFYFLIILCSGTLILYANGMSRVYELVIIAGLYFALQGIYFILKSIESEVNKHLNIFLGSLFLALAVACRPTDLLVSIIILPYLIKLLIKYVKKFKENKINLFKLIFSVSIPYLTVGVALMWYNYVRFGNVFDFGAKYQLTINNMKELGNRFFSIPTGIICNLFSIPKFTTNFPFIAHSNELTTFYGYYYIENMIGGLFMIAPICFSCFYIFKFNKMSNNKELKIITNTLLIVGSIIAILSIIMAGSNQRYLIDYSWMIIISSILIFESIYITFKNDESKKILQFILGIITIYTFLISIASGIVSEKEQLKMYSPEEYYKTKYTICFWE